jgi:hypothetical protein
MNLKGRLGGMIALVLAISLIAGSAAVAAFSAKTGGWTGSTAQGKRLSFIVFDGGDKVRKFKFTIKARCEGGTLTTSGTLPFTAPVSNANRFEFHGVSSDGSTIDIKGRFTARRQAKGSMVFDGSHPEVGQCHGATTWKGHKA